MQSGVPYRVCVCVQTGLGWSQRADRVNSGVNCVSGGPRREVTLPPGNTEHYSTAKSPPHIYKTHLRHHNHKNNSASMQELWYSQKTAGIKTKLS